MTRLLFPGMVALGISAFIAASLGHNQHNADQKQRDRWNRYQFGRSGSRSVGDRGNKRSAHSLH